MKVKIGDQVYDANDTPIMLILDDVDKRNINNMSKEAKKFCAHPDDVRPKDIQQFMEITPR